MDHDQMHTYFVKAEWDAEAKVWYVSNTDVPGLAAEADTTEALFALLQELIPELIELNGDGQHSNIPYSVMLDKFTAPVAVGAAA